MQKSHIQKTIALSANVPWFLWHFENGLIHTLIAKGYQVHCIAQYDKNIFKKLENIGCVCHSVHLNRKGMNPFKDIITIVQYIKLLRKIHPKILLNFTIKPVIYGSIASQLLKIKTVNTITGLGTAFIAGGIKEKIVKTLYKISQKKTEKIFVLNKEDKKVFQDANLCNTDILTIVPGAGVNLEKFMYSLKKQTSTITFLFIGRLLKDKGIQEYIQAAKYISTKHTNVQFQILGHIDTENISAITKEELNTELEKNSHLSYLGVTDTVANHIQTVDCVVLPSYREGVPTVLLEALAIGRPIITTDAPGCKETVIDGKNGYLVPIKDTDALTHAMEKMLLLTHEDRVTMGKLGREKAEKEFDEKIVIQKYLDVITSL